MYTGICCMTRHELLWCIPLTSHDAAQYWSSTDIRQRKDISTLLARKTSGDKKPLLFEHGPLLSSARRQEGESKNDTLDTPPRQEQQYTHRIPSQNLSSKHIVTHMVEWSRNNTNIYLIPVKVSQSLKAAGWRRGAKKINKNKKLQK